jgi:DNA repair exonuclease SbcCD ATPase subunit
VLDVARSLQRRNALPIETGARLWLHYTAAAFQSTSSAPRICVFYDDLLADPHEQVARLNRFITGRKRLAATQLERIREAVDLELHHHHSSLVDVVRERALPDAAKSLFVMLRTSAPDALATGSSGFDEVVGSLRAVAGDPAPGPIIEELGAESERLGRELEQRTGELSERRRELEERTGELEARTRELEDRTRQLEARTSELDARTRELEALTAEYRSLSSAHLAALGTNQELGAQLQSIFNSRAWRWLTEYRRMRRWFDRRSWDEQTATKRT